MCKYFDTLIHTYGQKTKNNISFDELEFHMWGNIQVDNSCIFNVILPLCVYFILFSTFVVIVLAIFICL